MSAAEAMPVVEMRGITKRFGTFTANEDINLMVGKGEIHALLGENGAGKSTLMNILFGLYQPDEGEVLINGKKTRINGPNDAIANGIGMVHQHFKLVEPFTVTENIVLGSEPKRGMAVDYRTAEEQVGRISEQYGLKVDPRSKIEEISVGMQQRVEILKTLYRGADILIFDEPTAVLTPQEIHELIEIMRNLVKEGKSIILITHKLKEIMAIADKVTVIRRGKVIDSVEIAQTTEADLAEKMVGRHVSFEVQKTEASPGEVILDVKNLRAKSVKGVDVLQGISFQVRAGEVLGIAGVDGNGQSELIEALTGLRPVSGGEVLLRGKAITGQSPRAITESGLSLIPEDRHKHGLVLDFTMSENMVLNTYFHPEFLKSGLLDHEAIKAHADKLIREFDVRTSSLANPARALSGGNQQKAIIAREIHRNPDLLIAAQPTRGLDVGAIEYIHKRLIEQRDKGKGILLISFELDEILKVSDRILVIYEGRIVGEVDPKLTNDQELGLLMAGSTAEKKGGSLQ
ncbi:ABC transporter ATP-binding protein [Paenibacillus turpanensis]|uniref:ABC transporter ATP-binding protein n=1 Tax=Paenibacillus turpanensis TaxID=2689078 RepID=UPI00140D5AE0|nr:ABC transporter ATP-binding protein [Paenibacillus turpanensis]